MWPHHKRRWIIGGLIVLLVVLLTGVLAQAQFDPRLMRPQPGSPGGGTLIRPQPVMPGGGRFIPSQPRTPWPRGGETIIPSPPVTPGIPGGGMLIPFQPGPNRTPTTPPPNLWQPGGRGFIPSPPVTILPPPPLPQSLPGTGAGTPPVNLLPQPSGPTITTPSGSRSTSVTRNALPRKPKVERRVTPKVNKVGRLMTKAGPKTRRDTALRARQKVRELNQQILKDVAKAGLCAGKPKAAVSMERPLQQMEQVPVALASYAPTARSNAPGSVLQCSLLAYAGCSNCSDEDCRCSELSSADMFCSGCVGGWCIYFLESLQTTGSTPKITLNANDKQELTQLSQAGRVDKVTEYLGNLGYPPKVVALIAKQIDVALKVKQFNHDMDIVAGADELNQDRGAFLTARDAWFVAIDELKNSGLLDPDFIKGIEDVHRTYLERISTSMAMVTQYADVAGKATQPFSPGLGGGLNLSGGPLSILSDPYLPGGIMTQLGPDLVAFGTGGQGEFQVQVGSPYDVGYPLMTNVLPVPAASSAAVQRTSDQALVINPMTTETTVNFTIDQAPYSLPAGQAQPLTGQPSWVIAFDRGAQTGQARYTLAPGSYNFTITAQGWDLLQKTYKAVLDNSDNVNDFHYVLEGRSGTVPANQTQEITSKLPIVLTFDRGDGREAAHRELVEGTYSIGIDPQTKLLDLFPGPAPKPTPSTTAVQASPSTPRSPAIEEPTPPVPSPTTDLP